MQVDSSELWFNSIKRWTKEDFGDAPFIDQDDGTGM